MSGFSETEQRRSSYSSRPEILHQGHHGPSSQSVDTSVDFYEHQRSLSYHRYESDVRQPAHLSSQPSADPLSVYYSQHQHHQNTTSHSHDELSVQRRSSMEDYDHEISHHQHNHSRQRSLGGVSGSIHASHYQELSSGPYRPPSRSSQSSHSPTTSPQDRHSRSPQTPPLTPSPREYSSNQQSRQQHHVHHTSRQGPTNANGRVLHKALTREVAPVGPNRRLAHILSEQKRREKINGGFDELKSVVPECAQNTDSKATILKKAVSYILLLEDELRRYTDQDNLHNVQPQSSHNEYEHDQ
ncbi:hypothetical protein BGZ46_006835 [Entomortierella lignicola]|nr:hypothetical protein BGZ46_006835 [Entomortierella lignicola]